MVVGNQAERRERVSEDGAERDVDDVVVERAAAQLAAGCAARLVAEIRSRRNVSARGRPSSRWGRGSLATCRPFCSLRKINENDLIWSCRRDRYTVRPGWSCYGLRTSRKTSLTAGRESSSICL